MFELSIALKYLIPRRKQLSVSLIALMSIIVISLVVWLVLIFLSVTEGIEKNWLDKLTSLNAPLRITPTEYYYSSYYYLVDNHSAASNFTSKNIYQKAVSSTSDPYCHEEDAAFPIGFPIPDRNVHGQLKDPVKEAYRILEELKQKKIDLSYQDFEISGALMRLQLLRPNKNTLLQENEQSFLTQVSYLASVPDSSPAFASMLLSPAEKDLNHLFYLSSHTTEYAREDAPHLTLSASSVKMHKRFKELLDSAHIQELQSNPSFWKLPISLLSEHTHFQCVSFSEGNQITRILLANENTASDLVKNQKTNKYTHMRKGEIWRVKDSLFFQEDGRESAMAAFSSPSLFVDGLMRLQVEQVLFSKQVQCMKDIRFKVQTTLQKIPLSGEIAWENVQISKAGFNRERDKDNASSIFYPLKKNRSYLPINEEKETAILLAKNYRDSGILIGDRGYLSYNIATSSSIQEQRLPIFVSGFYDPGILSVGNRCILVPPFVTQTINASSSTFNLDKTQSNGILVWFNHVFEAEQIKNELLSKFAQAEIAPYWKVTTFREYDFAKDLLLQFQSDKYLFSLVAAIILLVACCNIISLLTLLVNDKKREIGILQAMGATTQSIALIFGICGIAMGCLSCLIGAGAAVFTLQHIDSIVHLLSYLQGHDAFNTAFFGTSLPNTLSASALQFIFLITPLLSLLAGLIPAVKACMLRPSEILRSE